MENTEGNGGPQADFVGERESSEMKRELKEIGLQADVISERELFTHCQLKEVFIKRKQVSEIIRKLKKIILV